MRRRLLWIGLGSVLVIGASMALAYILFPFYKEDVYRESLEVGFSAAIGRTVKLAGPISLTFSLHPRLVLENVYVSNPPWASHPQFFRADRLEIEVLLGPLLQRRLQIEDIVLDGAELFLEESPEGLNNWNMGKEDAPSIWSNAAPHISIEPLESGRLAMKDLRIAYQSHQSNVFYEMTIQKVSVVPIDERLRNISLAGEFRDVPFEVEFKGGRILDLFDLTKAWPIDGVLSANGASAVVTGSVGGPDPDHIFDLRIQIKRDRLSAVNEILMTDLPDSAPFMIASDVVLNTQGINLSNLQVGLGTSEIIGQLSMQTRDSRPMWTGQLTAKTLQLQDFAFSSQDTGPLNQTSSKPSVTGWPASLPFDADLAITVDKWLIGKTELGSGSLAASVREDHVEISPVRIHSFGGTVDARI